MKPGKFLTLASSKPNQDTKCNLEFSKKVPGKETNEDLTWNFKVERKNLGPFGPRLQHGSIDLFGSKLQNILVSHLWCHPAFQINLVINAAGTFQAFFPSLSHQLSKVVLVMRSLHFLHPGWELYILFVLVVLRLNHSIFLSCSKATSQASSPQICQPTGPKSP